MPERLPKLLIIDDDERNIFALSAVMRAKGFQVESATDGKMGLEKLKLDTDIDLVLMDIMMPVMDGFETTRSIRSDENFKDVPIIALTAKAMKGDRERCLEAGMTDYCSKPVNVDELIHKIRYCLNRVG